jgi:hypothetical protein
MTMQCGGAGWVGVGGRIEGEGVELLTSEGFREKSAQELNERATAQAKRIEGLMATETSLRAENEGLRKEIEEQAVREARLRRECDESSDQIGDLKEQLERERAEHHKTSDAFVEECRKNDLLKQELEEVRSKSSANEREYEACREREAARSLLHRRYGHIENWTGHPIDSDDECPLVKMLEAAFKLEAAGHGSCAAERAWAMHAEVTRVLAKYMAEVEKAK